MGNQNRLSTASAVDHRINPNFYNYDYKKSQYRFRSRPEDHSQIQFIHEVRMIFRFDSHTHYLSVIQSILKLAIILSQMYHKIIT